MFNDSSNSQNKGATHDFVYHVMFAPAMCRKPSFNTFSPEFDAVSIVYSCHYNDFVVLSPYGFDL